MNMKDNIASRWRNEWDGRTELARLGREFRRVLQFLDHVPAKRAALAAEGKLSRKGLDEAVRDHFASAVVPDLRRAAWAAEGTINVIAARRAKLLRVEFDKTDVAGAFLRRELRDHLCRMNEGQRVAAFMESRPFRVLSISLLMSALPSTNLSELQ